MILSQATPKNREQMRALIVDERDYTREKIAGILSRMQGMECVCQRRHSVQLAGSVSKCPPDIILMDMVLAGAFPETVPALREAAPWARVLLYTDNPEEECRRAAAAMGAHKLVALKDIQQQVEEILKCSDESHCS